MLYLDGRSTHTLEKHSDAGHPKKQDARRQRMESIWTKTYERKSRPTLEGTVEALVYSNGPVRGRHRPGSWKRLFQ